MQVDGKMEFYPEKFHGLDPTFMSRKRMYICDVINLTQHPLCPDMLVYKNHPVYKVDLMGLLVKVVERDRFFSYAIDDGTGVINCCCWKSQAYPQKPMSANSVSVGLASKLREIDLMDRDCRDAFNLGDLLNVQGTVKVYQGNIEVSASCWQRVQNPLAEIARMLELPDLYRNFYDIAFQLPQQVALQTQTSQEPLKSGAKPHDKIVKELYDEILNLLEEKSINEFHAEELKTVDKLVCIASQKSEGTNNAKDKQMHAIFRDCVAQMRQNGLISQKHGYPQMYIVLEHVKDLDTAILDILKVECSKSKHMMLGCHVMHIVEELHKSVQFAKVTMNTVLRVLGNMESESTVISTTENHYIVV